MPDGTTDFDGTVLVVEDSDIISLETADRLLDLGFREVVVARTGAEAIAVLGARGADLRMIVLDLDLKGESAAPVAMLAQSAGVPFLVASGHTEPGPDPAFVGAPILRKPYSESDLRLALVAALVAPRVDVPDAGAGE